MKHCRRNSLHSEETRNMISATFNATLSRDKLYGNVCSHYFALTSRLAESNVLPGECGRRRPLVVLFVHHSFSAVCSTTYNSTRLAALFRSSRKAKFEPNCFSAGHFPYLKLSKGRDFRHKRSSTIGLLRRGSRLPSD